MIAVLDVFSAVWHCIRNWCGYMSFANLRHGGIYMQEYMNIFLHDLRAKMYWDSRGCKAERKGA